MKWRERGLETVSISAETGWLYALGVMLAAASGGAEAPSYASLLAASGLAFLLVRLAAHIEARPRALVAGLACASIVILYAIARIEYAKDLQLFDLSWLRGLILDPTREMTGHESVPSGVALIGAAWVRNAIRGSSPVTFDGVVRSFSVGFVVLVVAAILAGPLDERQTMTALLLPVFAGYLLALTLAQSLQAEVDNAATFRASWLAVVIAIVAAVVTLAGVLGVVAEADLAASLRPLGEALRATIAFIVFLVSLPIFLLVVGLIRLFLTLTGRSDEEIARSFDAMRENMRDALTRPEVSEGGPSEWVLILTRAGELALFLAVVAGVLYWAYSRIRTRRTSTDEARESLFTGEALRRDLRGMLGFLRFPRGAARPEPDPALRGVERLYRAMLDEAARRGVVRDPALTPTQFAPELFIAFESRVPFEVTAAFVAKAYGRLEPPPARLRALEQDWASAVTSAPIR